MWMGKGHPPSYGHWHWVVLKLLNDYSYMQKIAKNITRTIIGIVLRTAAAFGRPWAIQRLLEDGAKAEERSGTGTSTYDAILIGKFWAEQCNVLIKRGGKHDQALNLLKESFKPNLEKEKQAFINICEKQLQIYNNQDHQKKKMNDDMTVKDVELGDDIVVAATTTTTTEEKKNNVTSLDMQKKLMMIMM